MTLQDLEPRLERPRRKAIRGCQGLSCRCPACAARGEDKSGTNGSVYEGGDDWLHPHCQKGCSQEEFMQALGLTDEDRRIVPLEDRSGDQPPRPPRPRSEKYPYTNARGTVIFNKERYYVWDDEQPEKGWQKRFSQMTPPSPGLPKGEKIEVLGSKADILYNLPGVKRAKEEGLTVYVNEGEKASEAFRARGLVGTNANAGGGSGQNLGGKWKPAHTRQLLGVRHVVVVADRDARDEKTGRIVGEDYAAYVAEQLWDVVERVEVVQSATLGHKDDAHDHFAAGHDVGAFVPRRDLLPADDDGLEVFGSDFKAAEVSWLIEDYLLAGKMTLLDGKPASGKTTFALQWAASLSRGVHPILTRYEGGRVYPVPLPCGPVKTLYIHRGEDENAELETVYRANGGVPGSLLFLKDLTLKLDAAGLSRIRRIVRREGVRLVIVDNLIYFLSGQVGNLNDADKIAPVMMAMNALASETGASFLNLRHMKKGGGEKAEAQADASEAGLGSVAIQAGHRGQIVLQRFKAKPGITFGSCERGSLFAPPGDPFAFRKVGLELQYLPNEEHPNDKTSPAEKIGQLSKAKDVLRSMMGLGQRVTAKELEQAMADANVGHATYRRARAQVGADKEKEGGKADGQWVWFIPGAASPIGGPGWRDPYEDE